ncbi:hypothetical protein EV363DRAFT_1379717 [Boletus edulis]|nr:hypothetical protein EV363DRAFT_1379717 [Boletus edulis]
MSRSTSEQQRSRAEGSLLRSQGDQSVGRLGKLQRSVSMINMAGVRYAGEAGVYSDESGKAVFDQKYAKELMSIERTRMRISTLLKRDIGRNLTQLQECANLWRTPEKQKETSQAFRDGLELKWSLGVGLGPMSDRHLAVLSPDATRRIPQTSSHRRPPLGCHNEISHYISTSKHPASDCEAVEPAVDRMVISKSKSMFASLRIRERQPKDCS